MNVSKIIDAPAHEVWDVIARFDRWPSWGPSVSRVRCDDALVREGARGAVRTPLGVWIDFEVTDVVDGVSWSWRVLGREATGHAVEPLGHSRSRLSFSLPSWAFPYALVCELALRRVAALVES